MKIITLEEMMKDEGIIGKCARAFFALHTLEDVEVGKYPLSDGCKVVVSEYATKDVAKYEAHKRFIDVQLLASGKEEMRYAPLAAGREQAPYNAEKDVTFYDVEGDYEEAFLTAGQAIVFYPEDLHAPNMGVPTSHNKKLVFKIPVEKL